jgi:hypothetical protein
MKNFKPLESFQHSCKSLEKILKGYLSYISLIFYELYLILEFKVNGFEFVSFKFYLKI